jgi:hypothetical protein
MPNTKLLGKGNPIQVDPAQSELAQLDVSSCRSIRLSVGSWADSPGPVSSLLRRLTSRTRRTPTSSRASTPSPSHRTNGPATASHRLSVPVVSRRVIRRQQSPGDSDQTGWHRTRCYGRVSFTRAGLRGGAGRRGSSAGGVDRVAIRSPLRTLAALIRARWVNNWGQLPTCRPRASS